MALYLHFGEFRKYVVATLDDAIRVADAEAAAKAPVNVAIKAPA
ncbi:MAG: hypothetical protein ACC645_25465 [Pirellulales bacterium]